MSDLFLTQSTVKQSDCDDYAQAVLGGPCRALGWQGHHSYTVESENERTIIQSRSQESPLDQEVVDLAKTSSPPGANHQMSGASEER